MVSSEEASSIEAAENFHIDAITLTIDRIPSHDIGCLVGRVIWKSDLQRVGKAKDVCALHITLLDACGVEIGGTVLGELAQMFNDALQVGSIYKFANVVKICKSGNFINSRLVNQPIELRFSNVVLPEKIVTTLFTDIDLNLLRCDYNDIETGEIESIVGLLVPMSTSEGNPHLLELDNGFGDHCFVELSKSKLFELVSFDPDVSDTLAVIGVAKHRQIQCYCKKKRAIVVSYVFRSFDDSIFIKNPETMVMGRSSLLMKTFSVLELLIGKLFSGFVSLMRST